MSRRLAVFAATAAIAFFLSCNNSGGVNPGTNNGNGTGGEDLNPGQAPTGIKAPEELWGWWYSTEGVPLSLSGQNFRRYQSFYVAEDRLYAAESTEYQARASGVAPKKYYAYRSYSDATLVTDALSVVRVSAGQGGWVQGQVRITYMHNNSLISYDALRASSKGGFSGTVEKLTSSARSFLGERVLVPASSVSLVLTNILNEAEKSDVSTDGMGHFATLSGTALTLGDSYRLSLSGLDSSITVFPYFNGQNIGLAAVPDPGAGYTYTYKASYLPGRRLDDPSIRCINLQILKSGSGNPKKLRVSFSCPDNTVHFEGWAHTVLPDTYLYPEAGTASVPDLVSYELFFDIPAATGILEFPLRVVIEDDKDGDGTYDTTWPDEFVARIGTDLYTLFLTSNMDRSADSIYIDDYMLNGVVYPSPENPLKGTLTSRTGLTTSFQASYLNNSANPNAWIEGPGDPYRFVVHSSKDAEYAIGIDAMPHVWTGKVTPTDILGMPGDNGPDNPVVLVPGSRSSFSIAKSEFHYFEINVDPDVQGYIAPPDFSLNDTMVSGPLNLSLNAPAGTGAGAVIKYALVWEGPQYTLRSGKDDSVVWNLLSYQYDPTSAFIYPDTPITNTNRGSAITISAWLEVPDGSGGTLQSPRRVRKFTIKAPKPKAALLTSPTTSATYLVLSASPLASEDISFRDNLSGSTIFTSYEGGVNYEISAAGNANSLSTLKMTETDRQNRLTDSNIKGFLVRMMPTGTTANTMQVWANAKEDVTRTIGGSEVAYTAYEQSDAAHFTVTPNGTGGWNLASE